MGACEKHTYLVHSPVATAEFQAQGNENATCGASLERPACGSQLCWRIRVGHAISVTRAEPLTLLREGVEGSVCMYLFTYGQTCKGHISAVSMPFFAMKASICIIFRDPPDVRVTFYIAPSLQS